MRSLTPSLREGQFQRSPSPRLPKERVNRIVLHPAENQALDPSASGSQNQRRAMLFPLLEERVRVRTSVQPISTVLYNLKSISVTAPNEPLVTVARARSRSSKVGCE